MTASVPTHAQIQQDQGEQQDQRGRQDQHQHQHQEQRDRREAVNSRRWRPAVASALTLAALAGSTLLAAAPADAATVEMKALSIAASKHGDPYGWGATGPNRFDCSGLTYYAFKHAGRTLPRTAQAQYNSVRHISKSSLRPGDLVFFHYGSYVYHVGIYAGGGMIWHAPRPGSYVKKERIWTNSVWYGRP
ncbi:C40 family peptidase [Streptacidiphilus sp. EB129]|uniref:C40 family peptidase n=1 Tax=Streptacidiphilus sp. EB129 TaxID=3156262 RepID=UPI003516950D